MNKIGKEILFFFSDLLGDLLGKEFLVFFSGLLGVLLMLYCYIVLPWTFFSFGFRLKLTTLSFFLLLLWFILIIVVLAIGKTKGRSSTGFILGLLLIWLGVAIMFVFQIHYHRFYDTIFFSFLLFLWISSIIVAWSIGKTKDRAWAGFILGLFLTWLGVAIIIALEPEPVEEKRNGEPGIG